VLPRAALAFKFQADQFALQPIARDLLQRILADEPADLRIVRALLQFDRLSPGRTASSAG
jgi:hypothetical protein